VATVKAVGVELPAGFSKCLEDAFAKIVFPQPEGGVVTVKYPIHFTPDA
jgi:hypothetical protein